MISPKTPAGTRIVCIDDNAGGDRFKSNVVSFTIPGLDGLRKGNVYTVKCVQPNVASRNGLEVVLNEITRSVITGVTYHWEGFALERFELAALPKAITDTLTAYPNDLAKEIERLEEQEIRHAEVKEWLRVILPPL
jgi:hypothetical protein